jgi:hypothetical protein
MSSQLRRVAYAMFFVFLQTSISSADFIVAQNLPASQQYGDYFETIGLIAPNINRFNARVGQSFISQAAAKLTTVEALVAAGDSGPIAGSPPLDVSIYESSIGVPTALLGTVQRPASDFTYQISGLSQRATFDFSALNIPLVAGKNYIVVFSTPFGINGQGEIDSPYLISDELSPKNPTPPLAVGESASIALNGSDWNVFGDRELAITVHGIPEPSGFLLALLGLATFTCRRRI